LTALLFLERFLARVLLSTFPMYYEGKFCLLLWLLFCDGADQMYRRYRRWVFAVAGHRLVSRFFGPNCISEGEADALVLREIEEEYPELVRVALRDHASRMVHSPSRDAPIEGRRRRQYRELDGGGSNVVAAQSASLKLHIVYKFALSSEGATLLAQPTTSTNGTERASDRALLLERAAAHLSFQPRVLNIRLIGVGAADDAALPPMDENGSVDPYVVFRLLPPGGGKPYPDRGVRSSVKYRNARPLWNQALEVTLRGGTTNHDGFHHSGRAAAGTQLHVQVYDADMGMWGFLLWAASTGAAALAAAVVAGYILGLTDTLTEPQQQLLGLVSALTAGLLLASILHSVYLRIEDDLIGQCTLPLATLMDQQSHTYELEVQPPPSSLATLEGGSLHTITLPSEGPSGLVLKDAADGLVCVSGAEPGSQADRARFPLGALVISVDGASIDGKRAAQVQSAIDATTAGTRQIDVTLPVECKPPPSNAPSSGRAAPASQRQARLSKDASGCFGKIVVQLSYSER